MSAWFITVQYRCLSVVWTIITRLLLSDSSATVATSSACHDKKMSLVTKD